MLGGFYTHTIDDKGRVIMPSKLKSELGQEFIITRGLDNCLFVMSLSEWAAFEQKLNSAPTSKARWVQRFFFSGLAQISVDKQGRIQIPAHLREYAGLTGQAVIIGNGTRCEIWSKERWSALDDDMDSGSIAAAMAETRL